jgi:antitoxin HicB
MRYVYPCILHPEDGGGFYFSFPDVPGALTCGDSREEALEMAEDALQAAMGGYIHLEQDIPTPSNATDGQYPIALPPVVAAKLALYTAMREQGISQSELANRLGLTESAVSKLLDPDYGSHMTQVMNALKAVGRTLVVEDQAA